MDEIVELEQGALTGLGPVDLDSDLFGFYMYRRNLEDLADYVVRILNSGASEYAYRERISGIFVGRGDHRSAAG